MSQKVNLFISVNSCTFILSVVLFMYGFFPLDTQFEGHSTLRDVALPVELCDAHRTFAVDTTYKQLYKHVVLIVIDALADRFINNASFPFLTSLLNTRRALHYSTKVFSPTVTLPRIKTIVTGSVPGFADVILNLDAKRLRHDNILYQLHAHMRRIRFYGDDTWLKLFPEEYFNHSEGTTSFVVSDYTEVDRNVTRNMAKSAHDWINWDFMILHYLGLDHIGHYLGPDSPEIRIKLNEMDTVIKYLYDTVPQDSLLVITGDHGMSLTGNHGGSSDDEMIVPLIFVTNAHKWKDSTPPSYPVMQTDIAPTLSLLMGLPIPKGSYGQVIDELLQAHPELQDGLRRVFRVQYNLQQLLHVYSSHFQHRDVIQGATGTLCYYLEQLHSGKLQANVVEIEQQMHSLLFLLRQNILSSKTRMSLFHVFVGAACAIESAMGIAGIALGATPVSYDRVILILAGILSLGTNLLLSILLVGETIPTFVFLTAFCTWASYCMLAVWAGIRRSHLLAAPSMVGVMQLVGTVLYAVSLFGSSFVEEEHQTWFFLPVSVCLVAAVISPMMRIKFDPIVDVLRLMLISRLLRVWNRQGDKWAGLPAISDWLKDDHEYVLTALILANAYNIVKMFLNRNTKRQGILLSLAFLTVVAHKLYIIHYGHEEAVHGVLFLWLPIVVVSGALQSYMKVDDDKNQHLHPLATVSNAWMLLGFILHRPENMYMFGMIIFLENAVHCCTQYYSLWVRAVLYLWFANAAFFYQGNANKLSTVDVAAGYGIGFTEYYAPVVGTLIAVHTYSGYVHWIIMFWRRTAFTLSIRDKWRLTATFLALKFAVSSWYLVVMTILRQHLFIWTVFSPKLLYEGMTSLVLMITLGLISVNNK